MKRHWVLILSGWLLAGNAFGQDALPFTRIDRNPVTSAFAGAGAAYSGTAAYGAFGNAAMLPFFGRTLEAAVSYQRWSPGLALSNNVSAGVAYKLTPQIGLALGYSLGSGASYDVYEGPGEPSGVFYPKNHVIAFGVGVGITEQLSLGANIRYARDVPSPAQVIGGVSADLFAAFQPMESLRFTAGLSTLGTRVAETWKQPASLKAAVDWGLSLEEVHALNLMADADYYFSGHFSAAAGFQYAFRQLLFVRAGLRLAPENCVIPAHLALGLGFHYHGIGLNLSFLTASQALANTLNIGLQYSF